MTNQLLLLVVLGLAAWRAYKFFRHRDSVSLVSLVFWAVLAWRILAPMGWHIPALAGLLVLQIALRRQPVWRARADMRLLHAFLPRLSREQRRQRASLTSSERVSIYVKESLLGKRLSPSELTEIFRREREMEEESRAHAERERKRLLAEELEREKEREEERLLEVTPVSGPMQIRFKVVEASTFPTSAGGELSIPAGEYEGTLAVRSHDVEGPDRFSSPRLEVEFTFRDQSARTWRNTADVDTDVPLDLERLANSVPQPEARYWSDAEPAFQQRFNERCMVAKLLVLDDGRARFPLIVGGQPIIIMTKYLTWRADLALDEDQRRVWVRVSRLWAEIWKGDPFKDEHAEWVDDTKVAPFYYALPVEEFLPPIRRNRFELGFDQIDHEIFGEEYFEARRKVIVFTAVER